LRANAELWDPLERTAAWFISYMMVAILSGFTHADFVWITPLCASLAVLSNRVVEPPVHRLRVRVDLLNSEERQFLLILTSVLPILLIVAICAL